MDLRLLVRAKDQGQQQEIALTGRKHFVLGRGPASAALLDGPGISREHVAVTVDDSEVFVADVSVNGTWVNGSRLAQNEKRRVASGDVVEIPGYEFVFQVDGASPTLKPADAPIPSKRGEATSALAPPAAAPSFLASFTLLDRFVIAIALASIVVAILYFLSS